MQPDSGAVRARRVEQEGAKGKHPPLAKCHLGTCTSNFPLSDTGRGESKYKMQKRTSSIVRGVALRGATRFRSDPCPACRAGGSEGQAPPSRQVPSGSLYFPGLQCSCSPGPTRRCTGCSPRFGSLGLGTFPRSEKLLAATIGYFSRAQHTCPNSNGGK